MEPRKLLEIMAVAERLKDTVRHCYTSGGRRESVAEHCWMLTLMAFFLKEEFPEADMEKVLHMCIIHDLGEAFTGDIPVFEKTTDHEKKEEEMLQVWVNSLPEPYRMGMDALYREMEQRQTLEAKLYKALDGLEALIQHDLSDLSTWLPGEYELQQTYCWDRVGFSECLTALRQAVQEDTLKKIGEGSWSREKPGVL